MDEENFDEEGKESKTLVADWLKSEIELCLTDDSDLFQIAKVIISSIKTPLFITRGKRLLAIEEEVYQEFNLLNIHLN